MYVYSNVLFRNRIIPRPNGWLELKYYKIVAGLIFSTKSRDVKSVATFKIDLSKDIKCRFSRNCTLLVWVPCPRTSVKCAINILSFYVRNCG